jgi:acetyl esterase/lipase
VGFRPEDIIVEGDSAGGNLALALTRYLLENKVMADVPTAQVLAPPGALLLMSPWTDMGGSHIRPGSSAITNARSDYLGGSPQTKGQLPYPVLAFIGPHDRSWVQTNPYISPASLELKMTGPSADPGSTGLFSKFPRTFIAAGGAEQLVDQIRTLKERMVGELGEAVTYYEAPDGIHDYTCFEWHEPERSATFVQIANWMQS